MNHVTNTVLLSTKLKMPVPRKNYVVRNALFEQLNQCDEMSIIYICGGAGTGKSNLLSTFFREKDLKNVGWLTLDATNSDSYSFWLYFLSAVSNFCEDADGILSSVSYARETTQIEEMLIRLVNRLYSNEDYYLVLDDFHNISDESLLHTFEYFLNSMPPNLHMFLISREEPSIYLGNFAVAGRLLLIDGNQMRLTPEEGIRFLQGTLKLSMDEEEMNRLNQYAEGWIGGLQLAAAAGMPGRSPVGLIRTGGLTADYLSREILHMLSEEEQNFLIRTCFTSYFNLELCVALVDGMEEKTFQQILDHLIQRNLFIICIDEQNGIYRYHNILSEYLMKLFS